MDTKKIIELIEKKKKQQYPGRKYYYYKPEEKPGHIDYYSNGKVLTKELDNTQEVYTNWFKVLVNQKIDYSLSKPVVVDENIPIQFNVEDILDKLTLNASIDSKAWLHIIINESSKLDWILILDSEIIAIYDKNNKYLVSVIRFWEVEPENKEEKEKITHVQIWTEADLTEFEYKKDTIIGTPITKSHFFEVLKYQDKEELINPMSFGFIPFIQLINNKNAESDIENVKVLLDVYNEICTGFINNVRKFQEMIMKLRGYGGQDLDEFEKQLKKYKVIPVDENGDFDYLSVEIPVEARKTLLDIAKKNIFTLGRGVDPDFELSGNVTNVMIKSKFANLDMKNSDMEKQIRLFYKQLIYMINLYNKSTLKDEITFNRAQIFNETEQIDNCVKSMGLISKETIYENHPWVTDVNQEIKRIEKEEAEAPEIKDTQIMEGNNVR